MKSPPLVVVKVGGSLLEWPELGSRLSTWLELQPAAAFLLVAGGGRLCSVIRDADSRFHLGEEQSHWLCVDLLSSSARILAGVLGDVSIVDRLTEVRNLTREGPNVKLVSVVDPRHFLYDQEPHQRGRTLPHCWDVTSDSIAARLAECLSADKLVLLKSGDPPSRSIEGCAAAGYVDRFFVHAAHPVRRVACVNLRGSQEAVELQRSAG